MSWFDPSANAVATPAENREGLRRVGIMMTPGNFEEKRTTEFIVAHEVWRNLDAYRRLEPPARPDDWPADLQRVVERIRFSSTLAHPKQEDKDLCASFGVWRSAVLTVESRNAGRVEMLLEAIRIHERMVRETGDEAETVRSIRAFVEMEYNCKLPRELPSFWMARTLCASIVQENELLPSWLRRLEDKPRTTSKTSMRGFTSAAFSDADD